MKASMNRYEILIVIALLFSPFTKLRVSFFGVTEALLLILIALSFFRFKGRMVNGKDPKKYCFTKCYFWIILISLLGWGLTNIFGKGSGTFSDAVFNLASYAFILVVCASIEIIVSADRDAIDWKCLLRRFFYLESTLLIALYALSRYRSSLFGVPLLYYNYYFCPMAENIHHVAMVMAPLPFIGLFCLKEKRSWLFRVITVLMIIADCYIGGKTGSGKFSLGVMIGFVVVVISFVDRMPLFTNRQRKMILMIIVLAVVVVSIYSMDTIMRIALEEFNTFDGNGNRAYLYSTGLEKAMGSPIVGFGPGNHIPYGTGYGDAHETLLTVLLSAGFIGLIAFVVYNIRIYKGIFRTRLLFAGAMPILVYTLGGDVLRRLPIWMILLMMYYVNKRKDALPEEQDEQIPVDEERLAGVASHDVGQR